MNKTTKPTLSLFEEELALCEIFLHRGEGTHPLRRYNPPAEMGWRILSGYN
jgi:hypothetical protein